LEIENKINSPHYIDTLGATHIGGRIMIIDTIAALKLINKYFSK